MKEGLIEKVLDDRLTTDIDKERDTRANLGNVSEVLLGPDPEVGPPGGMHLTQHADHMEIRGLVGGEVIGMEIPVLLGEILDEPRERSRGYALELLLVEDRFARNACGEPDAGRRCGQRQKEKAPPHQPARIEGFSHMDTSPEAFMIHQLRRILW